MHPSSTATTRWTWDAVGYHLCVLEDISLSSTVGDLRASVVVVRSRGFAGDSLRKILCIIYNYSFATKRILWHYSKQLS